MVSGEIPIELEASWFSSKCVEAQPYTISFSQVKHCFGAGYISSTKSWQTKNGDHISVYRVRL